MKKSKIEKFVTIDIEGDISSKICRENFTEETLFRDPETLVWLCSFYNGYGHRVMGIRLPHVPREFKSPRTGKIESTKYGWHHPQNHFPEGVVDYGTSENPEDYRKFLQAIADIINYCYHNKIPVFFKGFKMRVNGVWRNDAYDREQIESLMKKYGIECKTKCMVDVNKACRDFYMAHTHSQQGQHTNNQEYMDNAILHNLEDSKYLWEAIARKIQS